MTPQPRPQRKIARRAALGLILGLLLSQTAAPAHEVGHDDLGQGARCVYCAVAKPVMALPAGNLDLAHVVLTPWRSFVHTPAGHRAAQRLPQVPRAPPARSASV
jgi:hypothetical protein